MLSCGSIKVENGVSNASKSFSSSPIRKSSIVLSHDPLYHISEDVSSELQLLCTMQPKKLIDSPLLHVVTRVVAAFPAGALQSVAARKIGHPSMSVGILNCGIPFTKRCISDRQQKFMCPGRSARRSDSISSVQHSIVCLCPSRCQTVPSLRRILEIICRNPGSGARRN